jgi:hypothetical protein
MRIKNAVTEKSRLIKSTVFLHGASPVETVFARLLSLNLPSFRRRLAQGESELALNGNDLE